MEIHNIDNTVFSGHAVQRMFERGITRDDVKTVIKQGKIVKEYPDDKPYPSYIILGFVKGKAIHTVAALNKDERSCYIITAYYPDPAIWSETFMERRSI